MMKFPLAGLLLALAATMPAGAADKPERKTTTKAHAAAIKKHEPVVLAPVELSPEQMAISNKVLVGQINCELGTVVTMSNDELSPGRFFLEIGKQRFVMLPALTSTGAVRLEDEANGAVWLQLGNKSMLMNQKEGKRLADECMNPDQLLVAQALALSPQPSLLDAPTDALVPIGSGGKVQVLVPNPPPPLKVVAKAKKQKKSK